MTLLLADLRKKKYCPDKGNSQQPHAGNKKKRKVKSKPLHLQAANFFGLVQGGCLLLGQLVWAAHVNSSQESLLVMTKNFPNNIVKISHQNQ